MGLLSHLRLFKRVNILVILFLTTFIQNVFGAWNSLVLMRIFTYSLAVLMLRVFCEWALQLHFLRSLILFNLYRFWKVDNVLISCSFYGWFELFSKKWKKSWFFLRWPLVFIPENSIIGLTLERVTQNDLNETKARETFGKIEGIGDVLSDGPRKFLGSLLRKTGQTI